MEHSGVSALSIRLLGGFEFRVHGVPQPIPHQGQRVLAYLAVAALDQPCATRRAVAGRLWPDLTNALALARLRGSIWQANHLQRLVVADRNSLSIDQSVDIDVQHLLRWTTTIVSQQGVLDHVATGTAPTSGILLPYWDEDWIEIQRIRLEQLEIHALEKMREQCRSQREIGAAIDYALRVIERDPYRESAHAALIDLYYLDGNAHAASVQHRRYTELMNT